MYTYTLTPIVLEFTHHCAYSSPEFKKKKIWNKEGSYSCQKVIESKRKEKNTNLSLGFCYRSFVYLSSMSYNIFNYESMS